MLFKMYQVTSRPFCQYRYLVRGWWGSKYFTDFALNK
jgi:hypothetical protein